MSSYKNDIVWIDPIYNQILYPTIVDLQKQNL